MKLKESLKEMFCPKYTCLEDDSIGGIDVITLGTDDEPYVLNFEIGDGAISINVIDRDAGTLVDEYSDEFTEDTFADCVSNAVATYESIVKSKETIKEIQENRAQREKFDTILADGRPEVFADLTKDELIALDEYIDTFTDDAIGQKFAHLAVHLALDKLDAEVRKAAVNESFCVGDKVSVQGVEGIGTIVDHLDEDPMAPVATGEEFNAFVIEYDDGTRQMADDRYLTLVESEDSDDAETTEPLTEDVNTLTSRIDLPCEKDITLVVEITSENEGKYTADYITGLAVNDQLKLVVDGENLTLPIANIYHGIISFKSENEDNKTVYRVDSKNCEIDDKAKTIRFNQIKSNDVPGEWYAEIKTTGSAKDILEDAHKALTESVEPEVEEVVIGTGDDTLLADACLRDLLYEVSKRIAEMGSSAEDETVKVICDDIGAEVEQIISELQPLINEEV